MMSIRVKCYIVCYDTNCILGSDKYYSGGFITRVHGSFIEANSATKCDTETATNVDAIQLETPRESRIDGREEERVNYGRALSRTIVLFYRMYYHAELVESLKKLG